MKTISVTFDPDAILATMESLKQSSGGFIAAPSDDYHAVWLRDHLYTVFCYYYLYKEEKNTGKKEEYKKKLVGGMKAAFKMLRNQRHKLVRVDSFDHSNDDEFIAAKYNPATLKESDQFWSHHQLDEIGLFLFMIADLNFKSMLRFDQEIFDQGDKRIVQLVVFYLFNVRYWYNRDFGMWEQCKLRHSSSIGAVVKGLRYIEEKGLAIIPDDLISKGVNDLEQILPKETRESSDPCQKEHHNHDCDLAQLSLIWPYDIATSEIADEILREIETKLVGARGVKRFAGDAYYKSDDGSEAEWPMGFFWLSIIYSKRNNFERAAEWFAKGCNQIIDGNKIPELYKNGKANKNTPLAWAHSIALIAWCKLPEEIRVRFLLSKNE